MEKVGIHVGHMRNAMFYEDAMLFPHMWQGINDLGRIIKDRSVLGQGLHPCCIPEWILFTSLLTHYIIRPDGS